MPTPGRSSLSGHPTRQQLDELEALMQRMLALPVNHLEEEELKTAQDSSSPATPSVSPRVEEAGPARQGPARQAGPTTTMPARESQGARLEFVAPSPEQKNGPSEAISLRPSLSPPAFPVEKKPEESTAGPLSAPAPQPLRSTAERKPQVAPETPRRLAQSSGETEKPVVGWWLLPLFWCNRAFDLATLLLGPLGRWLRGPGGRALLGWSGVVLLILTAAWLVILGMGLDLAAWPR
jgi:hypothetical protein